MDIFNVLTMIGGLCLFLFGMNLMGQALERRAGGKLRSLLDKMTGSVFAGFLTGLGITAIIQSSSATTVMVVGFVNSGLMTLRQAINVIMGANVGTTVTAWLLSLGGIDSGNFWIKLLKPSSFTPVLALIGIIYYMFCKDNKKKDTGMILLGFATLMFGMETMSGAVAGLKDVPAFTNLFVAFQNPLLGVLAGALLTAIIQSSSASVGILQALAVTGSVSYAAAIPIIMGQNIGTTVTALLSSIGTNKNARRAADMGVDLIVLTGNPGNGVSNELIVASLKEISAAVGDRVMLAAGKMHASGVAGEGGEKIMTPADAEAFIAAGADIILLPAPGTVPGITQDYAHRLIEAVHAHGKLALTAIGTSQEGADTATIRQIALMCKMAGADIHHIGDTGVPGMALPQNIMAYSIAIRGERHTYHKMAQSINR